MKVSFNACTTYNNSLKSVRNDSETNRNITTQGYNSNIPFGLKSKEVGPLAIILSLILGIWAAGGTLGNDKNIKSFQNYIEKLGGSTALNNVKAKADKINGPFAKTRKFLLYSETARRLSLKGTPIQLPVKIKFKK